MSARDDFWQSGLPFISDAEAKRVDWVDVGLLGIGTVLTSVFNSIAELVATVWNVLIIDRAEDLSSAYTTYVEGIFEQGAAAVSFGNSTSVASDAGIIGALLIVGIGGYLLAWVIGVIRDG